MLYPSLPDNVQFERPEKPPSRFPHSMVITLTASVTQGESRHFLFVAMIDVSVLYPLLFGVFILALVRKWKRPTLPYPPGPKGYPILGNVLDLNMSVPLWEDITSLTNRYGMLRSRSITVLRLTSERHGCSIPTTLGSGYGCPKQQ